MLLKRQKKKVERMDKINILQIVGSMNNGGVESFVMSYYRQLHDRCKFTFLCFDDSKMIPKEEIESLGGEVIIVPHVKHLKAFNKELIKVFRENNFDIIHSHLNTLSVFPLRVAKKCHQKIRIAHSHSISSKKEIKRHIAKSILKLFSKKYSNVYFSCSELTGRYQFGDKTYDEGKVTVIKNAINLERFKYNIESRKRVRNALNFKEDDIVIGTIGRFVETKNQKYILEIAKENRNLKFLIVGNGPLQEEYESFIKENNLDNVYVIVPEIDVANYYSAFDTFILPSFYEGFPITSLEAQTSGLYIVYSSSVPKEGLITGYGEFIQIDEEGIKLWGEALNKKHERKPELIKVVKEKGYEISDAANELYQKYLDLIEEYK